MPAPNVGKGQEGRAVQLLGWQWREEEEATEPFLLHLLSRCLQLHQNVLII